MPAGLKTLVDYGKLKNEYATVLAEHFDGQNFVLPPNLVKDYFEKDMNAFAKLARTYVSLLNEVGIQRIKTFNFSSEKTKRLFKGHTEEEIQLIKKLVLLKEEKEVEDALVSECDAADSGGAEAPADSSPPVKDGRPKARGKKNSPKKRHSATELLSLHPDWQRIHRYVELDEETLRCVCGAIKTRAGERVVVRVGITPIQFFFEFLHLPIYTCRDCQGAECDRDAGQTNTIRTPIGAFDAPLFVKGSSVSPTVHCDVITSKMVYDLPLYKLEKRYRSNGLPIPRNTMANWVIKISDFVDPLYSLMREKLRTNPLVNMDETPIQVHREDGRSNTSESYFWLAVGRGVAPLAIFHYAPSHGSAVVGDILGLDFSGTLQTDGLSAYTAYAKKSEGDVTQAFCLAHVRRKFSDLVQTKLPLAGDKLAMKLLFLCNDAFEAHRLIVDTPGLSPEEVVQAKHARVGPILDRIEEALNEAVKRGRKGDPVADGARYGLNRMPGLRAYLDDPIAAPDNNIAERAIKEIVLGRKNWLFCDSPEGARAVAIFKSLVVSAAMNGLNPEWYIRHVLWNILKADTREKLEALLPYNVTAEDLAATNAAFAM